MPRGRGEALREGIEQGGLGGGRGGEGGGARVRVVEGLDQRADVGAAAEAHAERVEHGGGEGPRAAAAGPCA